MAAARTVTVLLHAWRGGDHAALEELMPLIYDELHRLAAAHLRGERADHTFRPTELVSEAYLRLTDATHPEWNDRVHFYSIASRTMRRVLVDHARRRNAVKRGDGVRPATLEDGIVAADAPSQILALDEALEALERYDARKARAVELHYFGGMTHDEIAQLLDVHVNTVARDLRFSIAWLCRRLNEPGDPGSS